MNVSGNLKEAVRSGNLADIRGALWSCLIVDPGMTGKYLESYTYVVNAGVSVEDLYEDDDGVSFDAEASDANLDALIGLLHVNFSKHKLDALSQMEATLRAKSPTLKSKPTTRSTSAGREDPPHRGRSDAGERPGNPNSKAIAIIAIVVAVAILVIGGCVICKMCGNEGSKVEQVGEK